MWIEHVKTVLPVQNYDIAANESVFNKHGPLFKGLSKRGLVVGPSGCGKTNVIITLLTHLNGLRFENVYLYCKSFYQPKYKFLEAVLEPLPEIDFYKYSSDSELLSPEDIKPNSVVIFDDIAACDQNKIREYFSFGRHKNTDCFYLCQTYTSIPKQLIRDNSNLLIIFPQDLLNLKHIYDDHTNFDMSFQQFKDICSECWQDPYGFLVIDKDCAKDNGRYRKDFDKFIHL